MKNSLFISFILVMVPVLLAGCASEESRSLTAARQGWETGADDFSLEVELCRKVSRKSGRRIGVGDEFKVTQKSYVRAFADFKNVQQDRDYTVHLVWIKPGGKELFRKFVEVRQTEVAEGYSTVINWRDAEDILKVKSDTLVTEAPEFTLPIKYNISAKKKRMPGEHHFRVYLDRALVLEKAFHVIGPVPAREEDEESVKVAS